MTVVYQAELPSDVPTALPVLSLVDPAPFPSSLIKLTTHAAAIAGVSEGEYVELRFAEPWSSLRRGSDEVAVHARSGALRTRMIGSGTPPPFTFSDVEAVAIATQFAANLGLPGRGEARSVTHLRIAGRTIVGNPIPERLLDAEVSFQRHIDGVPVDGPGGSLAVRINGHGAVVSSQLLWREIRSVVTRVTVQSPDGLRRAFKRLAATKRGDVTVTSASLGYYEFGVDDQQSFLQPAYTIVYEVRDGAVGYRSAFVQHAGDQVFERLSGVRRFSTGPSVGEAEPAPADMSRGKPAATKRVSSARKATKQMSSARKTPSPRPRKRGQ